VRVRYLYDPSTGRRLKTVELVVEAVAWRPRPRHPRRSDDEIVAVRIAFAEVDLRERAKRLGAVWRPVQKLWEITGATQSGSASPTASSHRTSSKNLHRCTYAGIYRHLPADIYICP
jgi:hypothetical protein